MGETVRLFAVGSETLCRGRTDPLPCSGKSTAKSLGKYGKELVEVRQRVVTSTAKGFVNGSYPLLPRLTSLVPSSVSRPSTGNHPTLLTISVYRLREVGLPTRVGSAYRQGQGRYTDIPQPGLPTRASRSTDSYPLGRPTLPTARRAVNTCQGSGQYLGRLGPIPRYGRVNKAV